MVQIVGTAGFTVSNFRTGTASSRKIIQFGSKVSLTVPQFETTTVGSVSRFEPTVTIYLNMSNGNSINHT